MQQQKRIYCYILLLLLLLLLLNEQFTFERPSSRCTWRHFKHFTTANDNAITGSAVKAKQIPHPE